MTLFRLFNLVLQTLCKHQGSVDPENPLTCEGFGDVLVTALVRDLKESGHLAVYLIDEEGRSFGDLQEEIDELEEKLETTEGRAGKMSREMKEIAAQLQADMRSIKSLAEDLTYITVGDND